MRFFLISDNIDTAIGLRLAGVAGTVVHGREETLEAFKKAIEDKTIGILLVTELAAKEIPEEIKSHKISGKLPWYSSYLTDTAGEATGISLQDTWKTWWG